MRSVTVLLMVSLLPLALLGCGGSPEELAGQETRGSRITASPSMAQLRADLAAAGKHLPAFLNADGTVPAAARQSGEMMPQNLMSVLAFNVWSPTRNVPRDRAMWFECYLSSGTFPTDVSVTRTSGDPDLYVFSPLYFDEPEASLQLIGYSMRVGNDAVGSFYPEDWGSGPGRFIAAVAGCQNSNGFRIKFW